MYLYFLLQLLLLLFIFPINRNAYKLNIKKVKHIWVNNLQVKQLF